MNKIEFKPMSLIIGALCITATIYLILIMTGYLEGFTGVPDRRYNWADARVSVQPFTPVTSPLPRVPPSPYGVSVQQFTPETSPLPRVPPSPYGVSVQQFTPETSPLPRVPPSPYGR